ncbi:hypothetical protein PRUB_a0812 [Pseudoalteromonas rubra]|uniref:Hydrolase n=1 Tax=Pseudoalteromonas rubra TaxID=43658 RepID=A0A8T0C6D8_9GAMM|nr:DUF5916 domain-containing protein [Pseudoalteromonas rubra]KAF7786296.1 hypothetical protein PRUB_a0812 [Pseudoalteromonas rubra]
MPIIILFSFFITLSPLVCATTIKIDGTLDEQQWQTAAVMSDFRKVQPYTEEATSEQNATQVKIFSDTMGIYVGFINKQSKHEIADKKETNDSDFSSDYNEVIIDISGSGQDVFGFSVNAANSRKDATWFKETENTEWDGEWQSATKIDETSWYAEIFVPWNTLATSAEASSELPPKFYFSRYIHVLSESLAFPTTSPLKNRFIDEFTPLNLERVNVSEVNFFPYASYTTSNRASDDIKLGGDIFINHKGHRANISINPDFGHVESDDLVLNFDLQEIISEEKRPFFIENQTMFEANNAFDDVRLIETRRIGVDPSSDAIMDIGIATKYVSKVAAVNLGAMAVKERDLSAHTLGKQFYVLSAKKPISESTAGMLISRVENDSQHRQADVYALDFSIRESQYWTLDSMWFTSDISEPTLARKGNGTTIDFSYKATDHLLLDINLNYLDKDLDINDLGYTDRANIKSVNISQEIIVNDFPDNAILKEVEVAIWMDHYTDTDNTRLSLGYYAAQVSSSVTAQLRDTSKLALTMRKFLPGVDDQTAYDQPFKRPGGAGFKLSYDSPNTTRFQFNAFLETEQLSTVSNDHVSLKYNLGGKLALNQNHSIQANLDYIDNNAWLVERNNALASYERDQYNFSLGYDAFYDDSHFINLKLQWITVDARGIESYQVRDTLDYLMLTSVTNSSFEQTNLDIQLRYRYEVSSLSSFYLVYSHSDLSQKEVRTLGLDRLSNDLDQNRLLIKYKHHF